ncbi:hypothetical protein Pelo_2710 [Pelomyxa schiedti]|nr:hypothetical protein Pelo_2710 [Pelomyxa schiedti]
MGRDELSTLRAMYDVLSQVTNISFVKNTPDSDGGPPPSSDPPIRCYVVGDTPNIDTLFLSLMQAGVCTFRHAPNPPHTKATVTRTTPASDTDAAQCLADDAVRGCDKVTFWNNETTAHDKTGTMKVGYIFYRCGRDDTLAKAAQHILTDGPKHLKGVVLMLHTVEQSFTSDILLKLLDPSPIGAEPPPHAPLLMVNLSAQCEEEVTGRKLLGTVRWISIALEFCAFEIVKWTPAKSGANLANLYAVPQMHKTRLGTTRVPRPFFTAPVIMKVNSASVTEAHMIMKLVYDYSGHFPGLTVEMALRMWVRAKNWAAVGVVCRAHSFTQFEAIDLSHLSLESVPEELRGLSFKTLNLSDNKITKIPKWLAEMPNVIWGEGPRTSSCGVATTEECAPFLAEIGTIIHFRYPFWLLSPNHPGTAATPGLPELVIVEPHSFLVRLLSDLRSRSQPNLVTSKPVFNSQTEPALKTIMYEFGVIIEHHLLSDYVPSAEKYLSFLNPPHSTDKLYKYFHSFWQAPTSPSITYRLNGVVIQFALFPEDLFLKLISRVANVYPGQWDLQFWSRSVVFFSNSDLGALLFLTCNDERLTICLRSTDRDDWSALQRNVWTSIISTIHSFFDFMHCQYEETSQLFDWAAIAKERSPCPHCLLKGLTSQDSWLNPSRSIFLPPTAEWKRNDILGVLKSGGREMLCGTLKIPILSIAPDLIPRFESCSGTEPVTTVTTQLSDILGQRVEQRTTLEDLLTTLIEKGNGTTSVLDQVIPNGLRLKILRDVAQGLGDLHRRDPPIIHGRISPAYILVLSLDDSGTGPRAKIMDSDRACTVFSHRTRIPESLSRDEMKFVAPEVLSHSFFDTKADVWSFGMTSLLTLNPLNQPFTHITSNRKYRCTDYNSPATGTATTSHNRNKYRLGLNQYTVGRDLLKGAITPFPPSTADSRTHNLEIHDRLRMQIASLCLGSNPDTRPSMDNIVKIWDYFQPP